MHPNVCEIPPLPHLRIQESEQVWPLPYTPRSLKGGFHNRAQPHDKAVASQASELSACALASFLQVLIMVRKHLYHPTVYSWRWPQDNWRVENLFPPPCSPSDSQLPRALKPRATEHTLCLRSLAWPAGLAPRRSSFRTGPHH